MLTSIPLHGVQITEVSSPILAPADLPSPDHAIRMCPWNLESHDTTAQIEQINEEFSPFNQEASFFAIPAKGIQEVVNQIAVEIKGVTSQMKEADNGGLFAVWVNGDQAVLGFFDNGGTDVFQNIGHTTSAFEPTQTSTVRNFTFDTLHEDFAPFKQIFESIPEARQLQSIEPQLAIPVRAAKRSI